MRIAALIIAFSSVTFGVHHKKLPDPPCGIPKDVFYDMDMMHAAKECWSNDYTPCGTNCLHLKSLFRHYWNHENKCYKLRELSNHIPSELYEKPLSHKAYFTNSQDCGQENNGFWKTPDGKVLAPKRATITLGDSNTKN